MSCYGYFSLSPGKGLTISFNSTCLIMRTTDTCFLPNQLILTKSNLPKADTSLSTVCSNKPFCVEGKKKGTFSSPRVRESWFWNPEKFCVWNPKSEKNLLVECGIQLKESGIPLAIGIQNPSSTDKEWNPVPAIRNPWRGTVLDSLTWGDSVDIMSMFPALQ